MLPNASYTFGENRKSHQLTGAPISWPAGVDAAYGRPETILIAVTSAPQDLRALEQPGIAHIRSGTRHRSRTVSPLQDMVDQLAIGGTRDLTAEDAPEADVIRYDIHAISFNVDKAGPGQEGAAR